MNNLERIKVFFNKKFEKIFDVTKIEEIENQKNKMEKVLMEAKEELYKQEGKLCAKKQELKNSNKNIEKLLKVCKKYESQKLENKVKEGYNLYKKEKQRVENLEKIIKDKKKLVEETKNKIKIYENRIKKLTSNMEILKLKNEFSQNVKDFNRVNKKLKMKDVKDITNEIEEEFFSSKLMLKDLKKEEVDIESYIEEDNTEEYKDFLEKLK